MKKIAFKTFGCKLNYAETSQISRHFNRNEFELVDFKEKADIYVINSCLVTAIAEKKCRNAIRQAFNRNPEALISVIGCLSQLKPIEIAKIKGVDIVLGNDEKYNLLHFIKNNTAYKHSIPINTQCNVCYVSEKIDKLKTFVHSYSLGSRTRSFLKIQDGCDYFCSYCTIPLARGPSRSNTIAGIMADVREIAASNIKEIVLTGVNIGEFGKDNNESLFQLINELDKFDGIQRYRISSIEPNLLSDEIIEFVSKSDKFLPHFHIPLQSGSDKILKLMNRRYCREVFEDRVIKIKKLIPHCCIAADVIVGFPGETQKDFDETYNFIEKIDVSYIHVFTYSERPNTQALKIKDKVHSNIKKQRSEKMHQLSYNKKKYFYEKNKNLKSKVLFESSNINGFMYGFTENYIKVKSKYNPSLVNKILDVEFKDNLFINFT